jgi:hypothetical protein
VIVHFDVDDYYAPGYVSRMVVQLQDAGPSVGMVKLHAWLNMAEGWLYDPLRRYPAYVYLDFAVDPLGWGWSYVYWRRPWTEYERLGFGAVDASEEAHFFHGIKDIAKLQIKTFADVWYIGLRIVTRSIARFTGTGPCERNNFGEGITCVNLPEFMVMTGFGGAEALKPWTDMWDVSE